MGKSSIHGPFPITIWLVVNGCHLDDFPRNILGFCHHPNWRTHIFQVGVAKNHQPAVVYHLLHQHAIHFERPILWDSLLRILFVSGYGMRWMTIDISPIPRHIWRWVKSYENHNWEKINRNTIHLPAMLMFVCGFDPWPIHVNSTSLSLGIHQRRWDSIW